MENRHPANRNKKASELINDQKAPVFRLPYRSFDEASKALEDFALLDVHAGEERLTDSSYATVHKRFETLLGMLMLALRDHQQLKSNRKGWFDRLVNKFEQTFHHVRYKALERQRVSMREDQQRELIETLHLMDVDPVKYDFMRLCRNHDWYYSYSDDGSVYRAGVERETKLINKAKALGPEYEAIYNRCRHFAFNRETIVPLGSVGDLKPEQIITVDVGSGDVVLHDAQVIEVYEATGLNGEKSTRAKLKLCGGDSTIYYTTGRIMVYGHQHHWNAYVFRPE